MRPSSSIGSGSKRASPSSTSSPASSRASTIESSVAGFSTSSTTTFEAESSMPVSAFQSTWMSSPERNCFLAAARTASFIASITRSRSMPCSWQSASIFCAIDELIVFYCEFLFKIRNSQSLMPGAAQVLTDINLQIRFRDQIQRNTHLPISPVFKKHVVPVNTHQSPSEIALSVNRLPRLHFRLTAREPLEIGAFVQTTLESGRRYLQSVGSMDEIFHIENRPQMSADSRAILVGYTLRLVNEYTNNRLVLGAGYLGVHQL